MTGDPEKPKPPLEPVGDPDAAICTDESCEVPNE